MAALIPRPDYPPYSATGRDEGRDEVDAVLAEMERNIHRTYEQAAKEMKKVADDYFIDFTIDDQKRREKVAKGEMSNEEYQQWRISHMATGRRYYEMASVLASDMTQTNEIASGIVNGYMPDVFAIGYNYSLYQGEMTGGFQTSFTLYDRDTVIRLMRDNPDLLPLEAKVNVPEDEQWNRRQISSAITQSLMQGESIDRVAERLVRSVAGMNERVALRNARTATTSAENGGRYEGYRNLTAAGVEMVVEWCATLDGRTRHEHRLLDGQRQRVDEPFEVDGMKILYAGDPRAPQGLIWNCRCTMLSWVKGFEENLMLKAQTNPDNMSYAEWKFAKQEEYEERKARREENENKPRVNPDNPSYGYAADFAPAQAASNIVQIEAREQDLYTFEFDIAGKDSVNKYLAEMPENEQIAWYRNFRSANIVIDKEEKDIEAYRTKTDTVTLFPSSSANTAFHEVSHSIEDKCIKVTKQTTGRSLRMGQWRDYEGDVFESNRVSYALRAIYDARSEDGYGESTFLKDMAGLYDWAGIPHKDGKTDADGGTILQGIMDAFSKFENEYGKDAGATLGDMIDAITLGEYPMSVFAAGHGKDYWTQNNGADLPWSEAWAEISALHAMGNTRAIEAISQILPERTAAVEEVWRCVYEGKPIEVVTTEETPRRVFRTVLTISSVDFQ